MSPTRTQALLDLDAQDPKTLHPASDPASNPAPNPEDQTGFQIGWDHAHHGLVPPPELLLDGTPIGQGWRAGRVVLAGRTRAAGRHVRQWLALRIDAWREGAAFDLLTVTPNLLAQIDVRTCPVLRCPLGGAESSNTAPRLVRLNPEAAYAAGNLVVLSRAAALAWQGLSVADLVRRAHLVEHGEADEIDAAAWWRLAALRSFATPLPAAEAARLPMAVLPPNRVRVMNTVQALQVMLTTALAHTDWCARAATFAALLPGHTLRTDFQLWLGAIAPRLLEAQSQGRDLPHALADAWLGERVQRRWLHFVICLGESAAETLLRRLVEQPLAPFGPRQARWLGLDQALDGWCLPSDGRSVADREPIKVPAQAGSQVPSKKGMQPQRDAAWPPAQPAAPRPARRKTARTPSAPRPRATTGLRPSTT
jgi:hypothetical protein